MPTNEDILNLGVEVDIRESLRAMERFQKEMVDALKTIASSSKEMGKTAEEASNRATEASEEQKEAVEEVADAYKGQNKAIIGLQATIKELKKLERQASGDEKKHIEEQIKLFENKMKVRRKVDRSSSKKKPKSEGVTSPRKTTEELRASLKEAGEELKRPLESFLSRDAKGLIEGSFKGIGSIFKGAITGLRLGGRGARDLALGARQSAGRVGAGVRTGFARGGVRGAMGGGLKAMGGETLKGLSGALKGLSKLGPILGMATSALVGIIKLFLDADSMVKDFNKSVLQSASNIEFLAGTQGNSQVASANMENALRGVADAAFDARFNLDWGITKDEHGAVLNVLTQEGVALGRLSQMAGHSRKGVEALSKTLVATGISYSRSLGVPLQEINQIQAEMITELGMSIDDTREAFSKISRSATESGIAANKFFGMIRGVSQDLSLWNFRMTEAIDLLGKLGKIMSPKTAQKFFQELSSGFKNMGSQELFQQTTYAGVGKVRKVVQEDIEVKQKKLAKDIAEAQGKATDTKFVADTLTKIQKGGYNAAFREIRNIAKVGGDTAQMGVFRERASQIQRQQTAMKRDDFGVAIASKDIQDMGGQLEIMESALSRFGGDIVEAYGSIGQVSTANALGKSLEQVDQMVALRMAVDAQREILMEEAKTQEERAKVANMTTEEVISKLDEGVKDQIKQVGMTSEDVQKEIRTLAKNQGAQTMSFMQKFEVLTDWFMHTFYETILGIWEAILSIPGVGNKEEKARVAALRGARGDAELTQVVNRGGDVKTGLANSQIMSDFIRALESREQLSKQRGAVDKEIGQLQEALSRTNEMDPQNAILEKQLETAKAQKDRLDTLFDGINDMSQKVARGFSDKALLESLQMDTGFSFGKGPDVNLKKELFQKDVQTQGFEAAAYKAGATTEQIAKALSKTVWSSDSEARKVDVFKGVSDDLKKLGLAKGSVAETGVARKAPKSEGAVRTTSQVEEIARKAPQLEKKGGVEDAQLKEQLGFSETQTSELTTLRENQTDQNEASLAAIQDGNSDISRALDKNYRFYKTDFEKDVERATLAALRQGLYEYYLYSGIEDRGQVAEAFNRVGAGEAAKMFGETFKGGEGANLADTLNLIKAPANAAGGLVTGTRGGLAMVTAAAGEGLASVGAGERIVPSGGGASPIQVVVNGVGGQDLAVLIKGKVVEGIREYKRREKYH